MYCDTTPSAVWLLCHNTLQCIVIQTSIIQPPSHNTLQCIAIQFPINPIAHVAIQYPIAIPFSAFQPAIQFCIATQPRLFLQYNSSYSSPPHCNTISTHCTPQGPRSRYNCILAIQKKIKNFTIVWAVAQKRFLHQKNFFFFIFHFHSFQLFPTAGKTTKNYIYLFFFFIFLNTQINL